MIDRELASDEVHAYRISFLTDRYLHLIAEQEGVDLAMALFVPDGQCLMEVDSPTGSRGPEPLSAVAEVSGDYRVEVRGLPRSSAGHYRLWIEELRPATAGDRRRAASALAFVEAERHRSHSDARAMQSAVQSYLRALQLLREAGGGEAGREGMILRRLGQTWSALGEVQRANVAYEEGLELVRRISDPVAEAQLLNEAGSTFRLLGEPQQAEGYYQRALALARATGNRSSEVTATNNLGVLYDSLGEPQVALRYYDEALEGWRSLKDVSREADTLHNLGACFCRLGRIEDALDYLGQALTSRREAGDRHGEAATLSALGWAYYLADDPESAIDAYDQSIRLRREVGDQRGEAATLDRRGAACWQINRREEAVSSMRSALGIFKRVGDRSSEAQVLANLGWVYGSWNKPREALAFLAPALRLFQEIGDPNGEAYARVGSARAERQRGHLRLAQSHVETALALVESVRSEVAVPALRNAYLASRQDYYELLIELLMQRHEQEPGRGYDAQALEVSERARARGLLESLVDARADLFPGAEPSMIDTARSLEARIRAQERRRLELLDSRGHPERIALVERELRRSLLEYAKVQGQLRSGSHHYQAVVPQRPLRLDDLQSLLDEETSLLWFALSEERSFLWVVDRRSLTSYALPGRREIEAAVRSLHSLIQRSHLRGVQQQARLAASAVTDLILQPAAAQLQKQRLVIASDGALHYVPFSALPLPRERNGAGTRKEGPWTPLVATHEVVSIPSASVVAFLRRERRKRSPAVKEVAVIADPVFTREDPRVLGSTGTPVSDAQEVTVDRLLRAPSRGPGAPNRPTGFDRLTHSREEASAILALVPQAKSYSALDFKASRQLLLAADLGSYRILHFATHGWLDAEHPELSGVVLSLVDEAGQPQDGFLRLGDLYQMSPAADLVVLSACRTALGQEMRGEGLVGLTSGFLSAGASRVLVSLWNVDDQATAQLMARFYRALLQEKLSPGAALRQAQLSLLEQERWAAPFYWAGFTLQGEWE